MKPEDLAPGAPGHVRLVPLGPAAYHCYLPDPLPPSIAWKDSLVLLLTEAQAAVSTLGGLAASNIENPHLLIRPFMDREAVLSSQIEGTQTTFRDLELFRAVDDDREEDQAREVNNYVRALEHGLASELPVCSRLMREMHQILLADVRGQERTPGEFRTSQNWIGPPGCTLSEAIFVPPAHEHLHEGLSALERYINEDGTHPELIRLALFHYKFETLHPFQDGNGRLGRALITLLTCKRRLLPDPYLYLSAFFHRYRSEYYEHLQRVRTHAEWTEWIEFFLRGVRSQARDARERAVELIEVGADFKRAIDESRFRASSLYRLAEALIAMPFMTIPRAQRLLSVTHRGALLNLEKLVELGLLTEVESGTRLRLFRCDRVVDIVSR